MSGTERSGRRKLEAPEGVALPELGIDEESVRRYVSAVAGAVADGSLDPRYADTLIAAAKTVLQSLRQKHQRSEIDELREMLLKAYARRKAGEAREVADRLHTKDGTSERADVP